MEKKKKKIKFISKFGKRVKKSRKLTSVRTYLQKKYKIKKQSIPIVKKLNNKKVFIFDMHEYRIQKDRLKRKKWIFFYLKIIFTKLLTNIQSKKIKPLVKLINKKLKNITKIKIKKINKKKFKKKNKPLFKYINKKLINRIKKTQKKEIKKYLLLQSKLINNIKSNISFTKKDNFMSMNNKFFIWATLKIRQNCYSIKKNLRINDISKNREKLHNYWYQYNFRIKKLVRKEDKKSLDYVKIKFSNDNLEKHFRILAYTIISTEFFTSQGITTAKPFFFTYKINKFIKNFF